jgi:hypothetical protein
MSEDSHPKLSQQTCGPALDANRPELVSTLHCTACTVPMLSSILYWSGGSRLLFKPIPKSHRAHRAAGRTAVLWCNVSPLSQQLLSASLVCYFFCWRRVASWQQGWAERVAVVYLSSERLWHEEKEELAGLSNGHCPSIVTGMHLIDMVLEGAHFCGGARRCHVLVGSPYVRMCGDCGVCEGAFEKRREPFLEWLTEPSRSPPTCLHDATSAHNV